MARKHKTYRGVAIDMDAIRMANGSDTTIGNANLNARGDILGKGGVVIKTNEDVTKDYYKQREVQKTAQVEPQASYQPKVREEVKLDEDAPEFKKDKGE